MPSTAEPAPALLTTLTVSLVRLVTKIRESSGLKLAAVGKSPTVTVATTAQAPVSMMVMVSSKLLHATRVAPSWLSDMPLNWLPV